MTGQPSSTSSTCAAHRGSTHGGARMTPHLGRRASITVVGFAVAALGLGGCGTDFEGPPPINEAPPQKQLDQPVQHVFVVLMENHTYDSYFLSYPDPNEPNPPTQGMGANGRVITIKEPGSDNWNPRDNAFDVAHVDYDGGKMDGFDQSAHQPDPQSTDFFNHADGTDGAYVSYGLTPDVGRSRLPYYWHLADAGVLSDQWFSSEMGQSFPNHLYVIAASAGGAISNPDANGNFEILAPSGGQTLSADHLTATDVASALPVELENAGLTWTVLQERLKSSLLSTISNFVLDDESSVRDIDVIHGLPDYDARFIDTPDLDSRLPEYLAKG